MPKPRPPTDTLDADPAVYAKFGVQTPVASDNAAPYSGIEKVHEARLEQRQQLWKMLTDAKRRGFTIMIFQAQ
jgi:hypothetical protein